MNVIATPRDYGLLGRDAKIAQIARTLYDGYQGENGGYRVAAQP